MDTSTRNADLSSLRINREEPGRGSGRFVLPILGTLLAVGAGVGLTCARSSGGLSLRAVEVSTTRVALVTPTQASTVLTASGYIVARSKAEISPKGVGRVAWLKLEEGQKVRKGELVARLESQELEAQRRQAVASWEQAQAQLKNAEVEKERATSLLKQQVGSQQAYDAADAQKNQLEASVRALQAQVRYVDELIRNTEIYAPIDGVVTVKKAFVGETVAPQGFGGAGSAGATFAVIVDLDSLEMEADINEQNLGKLSIGQSAEVSLDAWPDKPYKASLRQIVPTADRQKGSVKVKVSIDKKDERILPEMSCRVVFLSPGTKAEANVKPKVMISSSSIVEVDGKKGMLRAGDGKALFVPLTLGAATGSQTEVLQGAGGGEEIVADAGSASTRWRAEQSIRVKKE